MAGKHDDDDDDNNPQPRLSEALKKILTAGVTAAFMTEESLRSYLGEIKMPKEILAMLLQSANKTKEDIANRVSNEIVGIVRKIDFVQELSRFAEEHKFKITAEIEVQRKKKSHE